MAVEPTRVKAQEIENTSEGVRVECRFFKIVPSEERASLFRRVEPSPECLGVGLLSKRRPSLTRKSLPSSRLRA